MMDKTTLINQFSDCVKLLKSDTLPDNLSSILNEVISNAESFAVEFNVTQQRTTRSRRSSIADVKNDTTSKSDKITPSGSTVAMTKPTIACNSSNSTKLSPRVYLTRLRLATQNEIESINGGIEGKTLKRRMSQVQENENIKPPARRGSLCQIQAPRTVNSDELNVMPRGKEKPGKKTPMPLAHERKIICSIPTNQIIKSDDNDSDSDDCDSDNSESDDSNSHDSDSEMPEANKFKPHAQSDASESDEMDLETQKPEETGISEAEKFKPPPAYVRRIFPRFFALRTIKSDKITRSKSQLPDNVKPAARLRKTFRRRRRNSSFIRTESVESDSYKVNLYDRGLGDLCTIS